MTDDAAVRIATLIGDLEADLVALRRDLHAHPEPSWEEHRTTKVLLDRLHAAHLPAEVAPTGTGVICDLGTYGPMVAIRETRISAFSVLRPWAMTLA